MNAPSLQEIQSLFSSTIRSEIEDELRDLIRPGGSLKVDEALDIHREGYIARLTEALGETYEACWRVLGDEDFFATCAKFIGRHPSHSPNLSDYGEEFPVHLRDAYTNEAPFLFDLSRFEWLFKNLFHIADADGLGPEDFASAVDSESASFAAVRGCALFAADYSVYDIWKKRQDEQEDGELNCNEPEKLVLYRHQGDTFVRRVTETEWTVLEKLFQGVPLADSLAAAEQEIVTRGLAAIDGGMDEQMIQELFAFLTTNRLLRYSAFGD